MSTHSRTTLLLAFALAALALLPDSVAACPVCFDPREENRMAFLATTVFLSLFPLGMVAGAGLWLRRRVRKIDAAELEGLETEPRDGDEEARS